mmetsp:Transcript_64130/g.101766  ORF Transcript_64130/g.101766 Transcript_64130/m.101766 type:complete len:99 (+) Transcript_64130:83-379(+)
MIARVLVFLTSLLLVFSGREESASVGEVSPHSALLHLSSSSQEKITNETVQATTASDKYRKMWHSLRPQLEDLIASAAHVDSILEARERNASLASETS